MNKDILNVKLQKRSYPIFIEENLIGNTGRIISSIGNYSQVVIITDENVANFYIDELNKSILKSYKKVNTITLKPGEKTKSFYYLNLVIEKIISLKIDRNTLIVAFGGGVIGDLVGLASSLLLRGLPYIQIPTTLLAQVDSSVGGKTGINSKSGKNLIGTFKQPKAVLTSINTLKTLKKREISSGYSEILKYSLIKNKSLFRWLENNGEKILNLDPNACSYAIKESCKIKSKIVEQDEKESGIRAKLNFGHTFGHVIESMNNYSKKINHGESVLIGMIIAVKLSIELKICKRKTLERIEEHCEKLRLKMFLKNYKIKLSVRNFFELLKYDKKVKDNKINFILLKEIGKSIITDDVNEKFLYEFLKKEVF